MSVSEKITDGLVNNGVITNEDRELYAYGFYTGALMLLNVVTTLVIGLIFGMVLESIVLMMVYIPLRSYSGGYHAKTAFHCYLFSTIAMLAALLGIKLIVWTGFICLIAALVTGGMIFLLSPVENANKPLDQIETVVYKKRARTIFIIFLGIALIFWSIGQKLISVCIVMTFILHSIMLILGDLKNKLSR
jgi:accessory gene regulator B